LLTSSGAAAILGALLFMASEETLTIHSYAMSDGLYLFLVLVCVTASTHYWRRGGTQLNRLLMWGSAGLAFLTRYVGVSLFVVPLVVTLARPPRPSSRKRETFVGFALAALPGLLWLIRNGVLTGSMTNRRPGFFPQDLSWWQQFGRLAESWFVPGRIVHLFETAHIPPGVLLVVGLLIGVGLIVLHRGRGKRSPTQPRSWLPLAAFLAAHLGTIALSSWFSYPGPDIDTRTLAPVFVGSLVLVAAILGSGWARGSRRARVALALAAVAFLGFKVYASRDVVTRLLSDGQGYTSDAWSRSATVAALQRLNPEVVYANDIGAVYYFTGRFANIIPLRYDPITLREREAYPAEYCRMRRRLREVDGVVVYFARTPLPEEAEPGAITKGLESIHNGADGGLYADGGGPVAECEISRRSSPDTEGTSGEGRSDEALSDLSSMAVVEGAPTATGDGVAEGYPVERLERVSMGAGRFES
ncbi:MAG: PMT protein, partial [candidate division NC10 bacterium]|nr:PMT protein [candidate division NC10 bacterium]